MNPRINDGGLQSPSTEPTIVPLVLRCHHRLHDDSPGDIDSGIPISVIGVAASLTDKAGLTLAVRFRTVPTLATGTSGVTRVYRVQWHTSKSSLVGKEVTQLSKAPGAMPCPLRVSNRAFRTR